MATHNLEISRHRKKTFWFKKKHLIFW